MSQFSPENCLLKSTLKSPPLNFTLRTGTCNNFKVPLFLFLLHKYQTFLSPPYISPILAMHRCPSSTSQSAPIHHSLQNPFPSVLPRGWPSPGEGNTCSKVTLPWPPGLLWNLESVGCAPAAGDGRGDIMPYSRRNRAAQRLWGNARLSMHPVKISGDLVPKVGDWPGPQGGTGR